jgi:hypothetical protein
MPVHSIEYAAFPFGPRNGCGSIEAHEVTSTRDSKAKLRMRSPLCLDSEMLEALRLDFATVRRLDLSPVARAAGAIAAASALRHYAFQAQSFSLEAESDASRPTFCFHIRAPAASFLPIQCDPCRDIVRPISRDTTTAT